MKKESLTKIILATVLTLMFLPSSGLCAKVENITGAVGIEKYVNEFFGFSVKAPDTNWRLMNYGGFNENILKSSREQIKHLESLKKKTPESDKKNRKKIDSELKKLRQSIKELQSLKKTNAGRMQRLFSLIKIDGQNHLVFTGKSFKLKDNTQFNNERDYLRIHAGSTAKGSKTKAKIKEAAVGGKRFYYIDSSAALKSKSPTTGYRVYCRKMKGRLLILTLVYPKGKKDGVKKALESLRFDVN